MPVYAVEQKETTTAYENLDVDLATRSQLKEQELAASSAASASQTTQAPLIVVDDESIKQEEQEPLQTEENTTSTTNNNNNNPFDDDESMNGVSSSNVQSPTEKTDSPASSSSAVSSDQHVIIFDWDDTLLASSFLASQGYRLDADMEQRENYEFVKNELKLLESCVTTILEEALQRGKVHIITNAETGWVELSAQKFIPSVVPYLSRVQVISARSTYEHLFPDSPMKWKYCAMQDRLSHVISQEASRKNIISFGDSHVEREAVRAVTRGVPNTRTKSIKFAECPNTEQLRKQLDLVANCFHYIFTHEGDLDLMLKMSMVPAANNNNNANTATSCA